MTIDKTIQTYASNILHVAAQHGFTTHGLKVVTEELKGFVEKLKQDESGDSAGKDAGKADEPKGDDPKASDGKGVGADGKPTLMDPTAVEQPVEYREHEIAPEMGDSPGGYPRSEKLTTEQKQNQKAVKGKSLDDPVHEVIQGVKPPAVKKDAPKGVKTP